MKIIIILKLYFHYSQQRYGSGAIFKSGVRDPQDKPTLKNRDFETLRLSETKTLRHKYALNINRFTL